MEINKLKPLNGSIIVCDDKLKEKTETGIYIPENAKNDHIIFGKVKSLCVKWVDEKNNIRENRDVKINDSVMYTRNAGAGNSWIDDGEIYRVIRPIEILAVIQ